MLAFVEFKNHKKNTIALAAYFIMTLAKISLIPHLRFTKFCTEAN